MAANYQFSTGRVFLGDKEVGVIKDVSVEHSFTKKEMKGNTTFAVARAISDEKVSGKIGFGEFRGDLIAAVINATTTTGMKQVETHTTTAAATITPTNAGAGKMVADLGVRDSTNTPMKWVASAPTIGQYSFTLGTGAYTFNAAQTGKVAISYAFTATAGNTASVANRAQNAPVTFVIRVWNDSKLDNGSTVSVGWVGYSVDVPKLAMSFKAGDFADQSLDFECGPDASGNVYDFYWNN
jgi:hypothetical protein